MTHRLPEGDSLPRRRLACEPRPALNHQYPLKPTKSEQGRRQAGQRDNGTRRGQCFQPGTISGAGRTPALTLLPFAEVSRSESALVRVRLAPVALRRLGQEPVDQLEGRAAFEERPGVGAVEDQR